MTNNINMLRNYKSKCSFILSLLSKQQTAQQPHKPEEIRMKLRRRHPPCWRPQPSPDDSLAAGEEADHLPSQREVGSFVCTPSGVPGRPLGPAAGGQHLLPLRQPLSLKADLAAGEETCSVVSGAKLMSGFNVTQWLWLFILTIT